MDANTTSETQHPRYNQNGDGGGFRMLTRRIGTCQCHAGVSRERTYRWGAYWYCTTCLHSIGRNAAGNYCTAKQYAAAWKALAS